jgi:hypothetical protein
MNLWHLGKSAVKDLKNLIQGRADRLSMACSMMTFHDNLCEATGKELVLETGLHSP